MIIGLSVKNYKAIKSIENLYLDRFHVLVGPNSSGKSTFLDVFEFVKDCLEQGPRQAVEKRAPEFRDLTFMRQGGKIEIDLWLELEDMPEIRKDSILHYHLSIREDEDLGICVDEELLKRYSKTDLPAGKRFEFSPKAPYVSLLGKEAHGSDFFMRESDGEQDLLVLGSDRCTLASIPPNLKYYRTANMVKNFLLGGIQYIQLNSQLMRLPCPATSPPYLEVNGTNLARVVGQLIKLTSEKEILQRWTDHLRYALEDLEEIDWGRRQPDNAEYIVLKYKNGLACPSWLVSDGTLRMLALTLRAFLPQSSGIYMVEEPENGVHPKALEIIIQSLSHIPGAQALVATHSPMVVQQVGKDRLLCFSRDDERGVRIQSGGDHPALKDWDGTPDLATIFAMGVLE